MFPIYGSRAQIHGLCIWIFYLQGKLDVVDTLLAVLVYAGIVDWYICWREGMPGLWRFAAGLTLFIWGTLGMTAKGGRRSSCPTFPAGRKPSSAGCLLDVPWPFRVI